MAAPYTPPFFSSRLNQDLSTIGAPRFGTVSLGDLSAGETAEGSITMRKYDGETAYEWKVTPTIAGIDIARTTPTAAPLVNITPALVTVTPSVTITGTGDYSDPVPALQLAGGALIGKRAYVSGGVAMCGSIMQNGAVSSLETVYSLQTSDATPANLVHFPLDDNTQGYVKAMVLCSRSNAMGGTFSFEYRIGKAAGVVTNYLMQQLSTTIDTGVDSVEGITVTTGSSDGCSDIIVTGLAGVTLKWSAYIQVVRGPI